MREYPPPLLVQSNNPAQALQISTCR